MITQLKKELLIKFVNGKCEAERKESPCEGVLEAHRIRRGWEGGTYEHRNIMILCNKHHKELHYQEF